MMEIIEINFFYKFHIFLNFSIEIFHIFRKLQMKFFNSHPQQQVIEVMFNSDGACSCDGYRTGDGDGEMTL